MRALKAVIFFASLAMAASQTDSWRRPNDLTTSEKFFNDVQTVAHDLQDSMMLKTKTVIDAASAIARAKVGVVKDAKVTGDKMTKTVTEVKVAMAEAVRAARLALLKAFANEIVLLISQLPGDVSSDFMQLPFFDFVADALLLFLDEGDPTESHAKPEDTDKYNFVPVSEAEDLGAAETAGTSAGDEDLSNKYTSPVYRVRSPLKTPSSSSYGVELQRGWFPVVKERF